MFVHIAMLLTAFALPVQDPDLKRVIQNPTGRNGYEEYVAAAIQLDKPDITALNGYIAARLTHEPPESIPAGVSPDASMLELYRVQVKWAEPALKLVLAGSQKPVSYPNKFWAMQNRAELQFFFEIAQVFARKAFVAFADGNSAAGSQALVDGLVFARKLVNDGDTAHVRVGIGCEAILMDEMRHHLGALTADGAAKLVAWSATANGLPSPFVNAAGLSLKRIRTSFDLFFAPSPTLLEDLEVEPEHRKILIDQIQHTSAQRREEIYRQFVSHMEVPWVTLGQIMKGPESSWLPKLDEIDTKPEVSKAPPGIDKPEGVMLMELVMMFSLDTEVSDDELWEIAKIALAERVKARLVGVYASVVAYRWKNDRLPTNLAEVYGKEPVDPASKGAYTYEPRPDGSFRVFCTVPDLGDVDLDFSSETQME